MAARRNTKIKEELVEEEKVKELPGQDSEKPEQELEETTAPVKAVITAPNENYCGKIGGVGFVSGRAELEVKDENIRMLNWFRDNGYTVTYNQAVAG